MVTTAAVELSETSVVARSLKRYARSAKLKFKSAAAILRHLLVTEGRTLDDVAAITNVTRQAIAYNAKKLKIATSGPGRPESIVAKAVALGYASVGAYFRKNGTKTFEAMSGELDVSSSTIQRHYDHFLRQHAARSA